MLEDMGRVYPLDTIANGGVPGVGAHREAGITVIEAIQEDDIARSSTEVLVLGSTASGRETPRSDVDILLVAAYPSGKYRDPYIALIQKAMRRAASIAPIEAKVFDERDWVTAQPRRIDPMFAQHIITSAREYPHFTHGRPIHSAIEDMAIDVRNIKEGQESIVAGSALSHMQFKRTLFQEAWLVPSTGVDYEVMQRALEFPKSAARRVLELVAAVERGGEFDITDRTQMHDGLRDIAIRYEVGEDMLKKYDVLVGYDHEYDELLHDAVEQAKKGNRVYEEWLTTMYPEICRLAWELAEMWEQFVIDFAKQYDIPLRQITDGSSYYY